MKVNTIKLGIVGGGQLSKMLLRYTSQFGISAYSLDPSADGPAAQVCPNFVKGSYKEYDDIYNFGKNLDVLTVETEHVNVDALIALKNEGKTVHPDPKKLKIIQDKGLQKLFYRQNKLASAAFELYDSKELAIAAIESGKFKFPFIQKIRKGGYDGKGVVLVKNKEEYAKMFEGPCIIEDAIQIKKEIAVIVARNEKGEVKAYNPVEMYFHPKANMLDYQLCPASISPAISKKAVQLAVNTIKKFKISGLLAVEMFLDSKNKLYINEVAPRPHNSGHHTIESHVTSQFEQHIRGVMNLPLGSTKMNHPSVMVNLIGEENTNDLPDYAGFEAALKTEAVYPHFYGKTKNALYRKMGHVTITAKTLKEAISKSKKIKKTLQVK